VTGVDRLASALADRYRIERELGAGGMATVYLAHDIKHDRRVALKVLRPELAAVIGAERFLAEIKTTANLQHPHILALFDSGQVDGTVFYVMPYVDGETLRDRITREKQLPIEDALRIAREVGDALQYAHGHNVIHRDIKPENILIQGGHALVADFGIALAASKTGGARMTETGMSLGTPMYMSPEQAMGERTLDARTDIYALGCVLYEMLAGDAPFTGSTAHAIVAKVLTEKPAALIPRRDRVPPHVEDAVLTALEKLPADRFASAAEFIAAIGTDGATSGSTAMRSRTAGRLAQTSQRSPRGLLAAGVGLALIGALGGWLFGSTGTAPEFPPLRLAIIEPGAQLAFNGTARVMDVSPDGQTVVFASARGVGGQRLLMRRMDESVSIPLPSSSASAHLRISPDGRYLYASLTGSGMHRMPLSGGAWTAVPGVEATSLMAIGEDGVIWWTSLIGSSAHRTTPDGRDSVIAVGFVVQQLLPGGRYLLGLNFGSSANAGSARVLDTRSGELRDIFPEPVVELRYTRGYLVYVRADNTLMARRYDVRSNRLLGEPVQIATDVNISGIGFAQFAVAENGTVVYLPGTPSDLVRVSRAGDVRSISAEPERYHSPRISPDGRRLAVDIVREDSRDVWVQAGDAEAMTRATFALDGHDPVWSRDGRAIFYLSQSQRSNGLDVFRTQLGSAAQPQALNVGFEISYTGTPLGGDAWLTTVPGRAGRGLDVVRFTLGAAKVDTIAGSGADESWAVPSPDGRWMAMISDVSGRPEAYVRALDGSDAQLQVSVNGGAEPVWSRDGRELFYREPTAGGADLMAAALQLGPTPRVLSRTRLFDVTSYDAAAPHANYDVSPDGRSFVFVRRNESGHIVVLQNVPELARRLSSGATAPR